MMNSPINIATAIAVSTDRLTSVVLDAILKISKLPTMKRIVTIPANRASAPTSVNMKYLNAIFSFSPVPQIPISAHDGSSISSKKKKNAARFVVRTVPIIPAV